MLKVISAWFGKRDGKRIKWLLEREASALNSADALSSHNYTQTMIIQPSFISNIINVQREDTRNG